EKQHQGYGVENADRSQLEVFHYEDPAERRRCVKSEPKIKPGCPEGLISRAGKLEEVISQHADQTKCNRDDYRDCLCSHINGFLSKKFAKKNGCFIRDTNNFVRCLAIKFEVELRLRAAVVPIGKAFKLAPPQAPLHARSAPDRDAYPRSLPGYSRFACHRSG